MASNCVIDTLNESGVLEYISRNPITPSIWFRTRKEFLICDENGRFDGVLRYTMRYIANVSSEMVSTLDIVKFQLCHKKDRRKGIASGALKYLIENARVDYLFFESVMTEEAHAVMRHIGAQKVTDCDYILPTKYKK